jgi:hypothetical protein
MAATMSRNSRDEYLEKQRERYARMAKKLLAAQTPVVYRADDLLSSTIMKGELNAFVTNPKFFDQEIFHNAAIASEVKT